ncbi:DNA-directed RNA polymerase subunit beta [Oceanobacillus halophilus]|uniref:DNA-directed RNA polymerase subunit beta n=1 Tax=Oceanobacillus halophilus TaxID=930130 RepID=A0A495A4L8_9BACI|nr:DNA-directed RNA polymerase subunit beta [Oceanobacillus halophilus]RKQ34352.1 DNA-directed RNA polymerase subunit beta [Oceanobacillus halophilus]
MSTNQLEKVAEKPSRKLLKDKKQKSVEKESQATDKQTRKQQKEKRKAAKRENKRPRRRIFPIWLRIILLIIFAAAALVAGLMVGYGIMGDGNPTDILKTETWQHIIDIVFKEA